MVGGILALMASAGCQEQKLLLELPAGERIERFLVADFTGDEQPEAFLVVRSRKRVVLCVLSLFPPSQVYCQTNWPALPQAVTLWHSQPDQRPQVLIATGRCLALLKAYPGAWMKVWERTLPAPVAEVCPADFDGDGRDEIGAVTRVTNPEWLEPEARLYLFDDLQAPVPPPLTVPAALWKATSARLPIPEGPALVLGRESSGDSAGGRGIVVYAVGSREPRVLWQSAALSKPLVDFQTAHLCGSPAAELVTLERTQEGLRALVVYAWRGWGFQGWWQSASPRDLTLLTVGDLNADGRAEIMVSERTENRQRILVFVPMEAGCVLRFVSDPVSAVRGIEVADVDADAYGELLFHDGQRIYLWDVFPRAPY